jgi:quinol monooxygenase YgiN
MAITAILELKLKADALDSAKEVVSKILSDTRAFEGCLGVDVLVDSTDETRWLCIERWASPEADAAYRAWRATPEGAAQGLGPLLAGAPGLSSYTVAEDV